MGGSVALPLVVEVAFGAEPLDTGTLTWTDISAYVKRSAGIDFSRGWDTEAAEPLAGRLTFTVNNDDGRFTPGETGAFGEVRNRLPVRVSRSGVGVLWTGLVESWRQSWENGVRSQVQVTCVDRWAAIRRLKFDGRQIERVVAAQAPTYFWPCTDPAGSDRLAATAGGTDFLPNFSFSKTTINPLDTGTAPNPQQWRADMVTKATLTSSKPSMPAMSIVPSAYVSTPSPSGFTLSAWINGQFGSVQLANADSGSSELFVSVGTGAGGENGKARVGVNRNTGTDPLNHAEASARVGTGWQMVTVTVSINGSGQVTYQPYVNGTTFGGGTAYATGGWTLTLDALSLWCPSGVAYIGVWNRALTAAEVLAQYEAGASMGLTGESASTRATRLLTYIDPAPSLTTTGTFTATMSMQDIADKSLADALMECATAEDGTLYMSTAGWPVLTSRSWRTGNAVAFTIPARALATDVTFTLDDQQLINSATVDRMVRDETAGTVKATADTSIATYGEQNKSLQVWLDSDAQHLERANAEANQWSTPLVRSSDLTVDILTKNATIAASTMLGADIGQRIAVSGMPSEAPGATQFFIESISDRVTHTGWERTFTVSPRLDYFTIENATFGVIDADNVLAF